MINNKYPNISPSLNLDFTNSNTIDPRITFSRASAATFYDGKTVAKAEENLLTYSQEFDNAAWAKRAATVVANSTVAPDGSSTADKVDASTASPGCLLYRAVPVTAGSTVSVYLKIGAGNGWAFVYADAPSFSHVFINLNTGSPGTVAGNVLSYSITPVVNGWYRLAVTFSNAFSAFGIGVPNADNTTASTSGDSVYLWGAQLEQRSSVTAYTPTTTQPITNYIPVLQTAPAGVPRFDHNPVTGESLGLLVEEQRTNLLMYSEQFADTIWLKTGSSISANTVIAPDGTLTADTILATDTNTYLYRNNLLTSGVTYTLSMCLKAGSSSTGGLYASGVACVAIFNLAAGTVTSVTNGAATITPIGNSFYRCSITFTAATGSNVGYFVAGTSVGSSVHTWGAQLEAGSFPTSYIKTEASQVTRAADSAQMTGANFSSWYRQDEGSVDVEYFPNYASSGVPIGLDLNGSRSLIVYDGLASLQQTVYIGSSSAAIGLAVSGVTAKAAVGYNQSSASGSLNGAAVASVSQVMTGPNRLCIGSENSSTNIMNGHIKKIAYYPKRLTDAQLQALTA